MTFQAYPDGPGEPVAGEQEALRVANERFTESGQLVVVDGDRVGFLRRDVRGRFVAVRERPPVAEALGLLPHPEGGWYRETWRTEVALEPPGYGGPRRTATGIYFLLQPGEESVWHAVRSDEVWFWHRGGPLALVLGGTGEHPPAGGTPGVETVLLGPEVEAGQVPQALVPAGTWQAARPAGDAAVLVSCVVSPGFDFADFTAR
ncbi:cupin domain-containing protein [Sphaerisporangium rufum]|nr:cupin domain-containing protein [Sphaerisporangium rufum]